MTVRCGGPSLVANKEAMPESVTVRHQGLRTPRVWFGHSPWKPFACSPRRSRREYLQPPLPSSYCHQNHKPGCAAMEDGAVIKSLLHPRRNRVLNFVFGATSVHRGLLPRLFPFQSYLMIAQFDINSPICHFAAYAAASTVHIYVPLLTI